MLKETLEENLKTALKAKDTLRVSVLRMVLSEAHNEEINNRKPLNEEQVMEVLIKQVKKHQDSIEQFKAGGREDLVKQEQDELAIINSYLPKALSDEELLIVIRESVAAAGPNPQFGPIMKTVVSKTKGRAQGNRVADLVKAELQK